MDIVHGWHASPQKRAPATCDRVTGEIRVPLSMFKRDDHLGDVPLVLSRVEGELLHAALSRWLNPNLRAPGMAS
ncbi:hypothetical protein [Streptomyces sulphureus]|uniref:hypothetical protein n=1 Tax=Streptomyces sulphureus TaxID=47758 RepID=UPI001319EC46|nr:hypothetical protein [Streptomyces sulphureus]